MERKVLGRGLEALIPADSQAARERIQMLNMADIQPSRFQPRVNFSQEKLEELAKSIKEKGVIQPILVRTSQDGKYELIAGERRFRACKYLGINEIPSIVRKVSDQDLLEVSLIENIQRQELNPVEEAKAYKRLSHEFGLSQDAIAEKVGRDKSSVSNILRLLHLPDKIQEYLSKNMISFGHAKALLSLVDHKVQIKFCEKIIKRGLSVRQMEALTSRRAKMKAPRTDLRSSHLQDLEERLQHALGTRVRIRHGKKRGRLEIDYYSMEDLDRLLKFFRLL